MDPPDSLVIRWKRRFICAGHGIWYVLRHEPSGRVHAIAVLVVLALGVWLGIGAMQWAVLALAIGGVIAAEALNTAIERLADRVSGAQEEAIRLVKDVAAGGVLAATGGAVFAGLMILGPPLIRRMFCQG